jgi:RNA polymerase sigma factor (sigma-70 family)
VPSLHSRGFHVLAAVPSVGRPSFAGGPARAPQAAATEGLYERHAAKILSYCLHQLGSREEAEDAVQTTFMNAFRALGRGVVPEAESAWLFKIAENVCLSRRRSSWRRGRIESPSDFDVIEEVVPGPSRQRDELIGIEDALASMPEQQRRAILLREWQGLSYREISEELELSQSAVETLIFRARRSLAQGLEQPDLLKKPKRKSFRRALHMIDLGTIAAAAKTLLAGSVAVKATAAAVAVTAAATAASVTPKLEGHSPKPVQAPALVASKAASEAVAAAGAASALSAASLHEGAAARPAATNRPQTPAQSAAVKQQARTSGAAGPRSAPGATAPAAPTQAPAAGPSVEPGAPAAVPAAPPVEPAHQPVAEQPIQAHTPAPVAQPGHGEQKPVEPKVVEESKPKQRSVPVAPIPAIPAIPAPVVSDEPNNVKASTEKERGRDKKRRDLAVPPLPEPVAALVPVTPVAPVPVEPAPVAEPVTESVVAVPSVEPGSGGSGQGKGSRRRK